MKPPRNTASGLTLNVTGESAAVSGGLTIATINNGHMIEMQALTPDFEAANPSISVKWVTLDENTLHSRVTTDISTASGQFDIMTIGMYQAPIWSAKGWLEGLDFSA